jgi:hypothetical protein
MYVKKPSDQIFSSLPQSLLLPLAFLTVKVPLEASFHSRLDVILGLVVCASQLMEVFRKELAIEYSSNLGQWDARDCPDDVAHDGGNLTVRSSWARARGWRAS